MKSKSGILKKQLETYEFKLRCVSSYVQELKTMTTKHRTPKKHYISDLNQATQNIGLYEGEIARIKKEMSGVTKVGPVSKAGPVRKVGPGVLLKKSTKK